MNNQLTKGLDIRQVSKTSNHDMVSGSRDIQSRIMAMAMNIIRIWW